MVETRHSAPANIRATDDGLGTFSGIASNYDVIDAYDTMMARGCFDRTVANHDATYPLLWQHDSTEPIGSFRVVDLADALAIEGKFCLETARGREAYALLKAGAINGISIGFNVVNSTPIEMDGRTIFRFDEVDLWEASIVTFAACPGAEVEDVRAMNTPTPTYTRGLDDLDDDAKNAVAEIFEQTAKSIRDTIGKAKDEPEAEPPAKEEPEEEPKEEPKDDEDDEQRAIATLRECRSILKEVI